MKQIILLLGAVMVMLSACTKSENTLETSDILRSGKWKMSAFTVKFQYMGADSVYDIYKKMDSCRYDDFIQFNANYQGIQNTAAKKCGSEATELPFDWELRDNNKVLMLNNAQYTIGNTNKIPVVPVGKEYVEATIAKINKASMTLTYSTTLQSAPGVSLTYYFTQTFIKQ